MHDQPVKQHAEEGADFLSGGGEMGERMRSFDWAATPLGAVESWPQSLKTAVRIMLTSRQPFWLGWGDHLIKLYNDAYKTIVGGKHPAALGQPVAVVWREIWDDISPMLKTAMGGVEGTYVESQLLIMERNGYPEETAEDRLRALAAGFDAHVAKPVEVVELATVIASIVRRRKGA